MGRVLGAVALLLAAAAGQGAERPNVIIMLADDIGWADVGYHGGDIDTPSLDRLAAEGVQLHRFYTTPICSPTRAALMTGRNPIRLGVAYAVILPWSNNGIHPDERFLPEAFLDAGYQTAMVGKWHLGHSPGDLPSQPARLRALLRPPAHRGGATSRRSPTRAARTFSETASPSTTRATRRTSWPGRRAGTSASATPDRPFFLYLPFLAPHTPLEAPEAARSKSTATSRQTCRRRAATTPTRPGASPGS